MVKKRGNVQEITAEGRPEVVEDMAEKNDLRSKLAELRKQVVEDTEGKNDLRSKLAELKRHGIILGYILKDASSAVVDLNEPARISDYAILSSATSEAASELSSIFAFGEVKRTVVEAKQTKMLSVNIGESKVSVFLEKNADVGSVYEKLR